MRIYAALFRIGYAHISGTLSNRICAYLRTWGARARARACVCDRHAMRTGVEGARGEIAARAGMTLRHEHTALVRCVFVAPVRCVFGALVLKAPVAKSRSGTPMPSRTSRTTGCTLKAKQPLELRRFHCARALVLKVPVAKNLRYIYICYIYITYIYIYNCVFGALVLKVPVARISSVSLAQGLRVTKFMVMGSASSSMHHTRLLVWR
jgi:hypothetical protein